ncbi:hypothetical protein EW145_g3050, partial [Phellinidium pouzarii]
MDAAVPAGPDRPVLLHQDLPLNLTDLLLLLFDMCQGDFKRVPELLHQDVERKVPLHVCIPSLSGSAKQLINMTCNFHASKAAQPGSREQRSTGVSSIFRHGIQAGNSPLEREVPLHVCIPSLSGSAKQLINMTCNFHASKAAQPGSREQRSTGVSSISRHGIQAGNSPPRMSSFTRTSSGKFPSTYKLLHQEVEREVPLHVCIPSLSGSAKQLINMTCNFHASKAAQPGSREQRSTGVSSISRH